MASRDSRLGRIKNKMSVQVVEINVDRIRSLHRLFAQLIPGISPEINCFTYRSLYAPLTRTEHLASLLPIVPQLCGEDSALKTCIQIAGSVNITSRLPVSGPIVRESFCEVDTERLHRRSKLISVTVYNRYLSDGSEYLTESTLLHYRLKPQLFGSSWVNAFQVPDLFDAILCVDESALRTFVSLQAFPERTSVDYEYATQTLGCPGLLIPMDLIGQLLLVLIGHAKPRKSIKSLNYHIYGQVFTGQSVRLCAKELDKQRVLIWAESNSFLLYRGILQLG